jgi:hypothetical protein
MTRSASLDIGAAWTQGALFGLRSQGWCLIRRGAVATTQRNPAEVAERAARTLRRGAPVETVTS